MTGVQTCALPIWSVIPRVLIDAEHQCMTTRGVKHRHASTITTRFTGVFKDDQALQDLDRFALEIGAHAAHQPNGPGSPR